MSDNLMHEELLRTLKRTQEFKLHIPRSNINSVCIQRTGGHANKWHCILHIQIESEFEAPSENNIFN